MKNQIAWITLLFATACSKTQFTNVSSQSAGGNNGQSCAAPCNGSNSNTGTPNNPSGPGSGVLQSTDYTFIASAKKVDIIVVSDNSGSMDADNKELGAKIGNLVAKLNENGADWQMCLITTENSNARVWPNTSDVVLRKSNASAVQIFNSALSNIGSNGTGNEQGIKSLSGALDIASNANCFRSDAALASIVISDEDERSCGGRCANGPDTPAWSYARASSFYAGQYSAMESVNFGSSLVNKVKSKFLNKIYSNHSIVIKPNDTQCAQMQDQQASAFYGIEYSKLSSLTGGLVHSICDADYATPLSAIGNVINQTFNSVVLKCAVSSIQSIYVDDKAAPAYSVSGDKIIFASNLPSGSRVKVSYYCK